MQIQWYPGHMTKTRRLIEENLKLVDIIIELVDARAPYSTKNPDIDALAKNKPKLIVLNKADLADPSATKEWVEWYTKGLVRVHGIVATTGKGIKEVVEVAEEMMKEKIEKDRARGRIYRPIRAMIVGIPNVGKSTFINSLVGKKSAKTGDKPGVTRGKQWIKVKKGFELLDMPGILWPKFEDQEVAMKLAYLGSIKDDILDVREVALHFLSQGMKEFREALITRYKLDEEALKEIFEKEDAYGLFQYIATQRGMLQSKGVIDELRMSQVLLDEFRAGKIGKITLEHTKHINLV